MKTNRGFVLAAAIVVAIVSTTLLVTVISLDTTLEFQVRDIVCKGWVWDSTMILQDRIVRGYFQADQGPFSYRFTRLDPGDYQLTVSAPNYVPTAVPVSINRGRNLLKDPIDLVGFEIPNLDRFVVYEELEGSDVVLEIRPVGVDGAAILNHPCLDLKILAMVSVQSKNGVPVQEETDSGSERGASLFRGRVEWTWDGLPETVFRYRSRIPGSMIKRNGAQFYVIDYLILVPDPRKITSEELELILEQSSSFGEPKQLQTFLQEANQGRFSYFFDVSWNVPAGG